MTVYTPNLPALIPSIPNASNGALPGDPASGPGTRARSSQEPYAAAGTLAGCCPHCAAPLPAEEPVSPSADEGVFARARQVSFLENLSVTGSVRSAAAAGGVSHQTAYRARRSCGQFRLAWDAALVVARAAAEATLASRAIDGVEEQVFYHGEVVATRRRYSDRLLLAHLGRLDRLEDDVRTYAFSGDWEGAMARFAAGEDPLPPEDELFASGPCNMWSMPDSAPGPDDDECEEWDEETLAEEMAQERPADAPPLRALGDPDKVAACQREAFLDGEEEWWRIGSGGVPFVRGPGGVWIPEAAGLAPDEARGAIAPDEADEADDAGEGGALGLPDDAEDGAAQDSGATMPAPEPEPEPEQAQDLAAEIEPPLAEPAVAEYTWRPIFDGRMQPFYGRGW